MGVCGSPYIRQISLIWINQENELGLAVANILRAWWWIEESLRWAIMASSDSCRRCSKALAGRDPERKKMTESGVPSWIFCRF